MVARLDFGLLRPFDLSQGVQAFQQARAMRLEQDQMRQQQTLMEERLRQQQGELDRERLTGDAVAQYFESLDGGARPTGDGVAAPSTPAMPAAPVAQPPTAQSVAEAAPVAGDEPMMTVSAPRDERPNPMRFLADIARNGNPQLAMQLFDRSRTMAKEEREQAVAAYDAMAAATQSLAGVPYEQRRAMLLQMAPALVARGVPANMIEGFDPTDAALLATRNQALGISGVLQQEDRVADNARAEAEFAYRQRNDALNRGVTIRGQNMTDARARDNTAVQAAGVDRNVRRSETDLRKEFNALPEVKEWRDITGSYRQIREQARRANPTAQNDMAIIFSYMKMLDPGSVVREGEFANAQNAAGVPDQIRNLYNRAASGNRLNPTQRRNMVESAAQIVLSRRDRFNEVAGQYRSYAADYGGDPDRVARPAPVVPMTRAPRNVAGGTLTPVQNGVREWRPGGAR